MNWCYKKTSKTIFNITFLLIILFTVSGCTFFSKPIDNFPETAPKQPEEDKYSKYKDIMDRKAYIYPSELLNVLPDNIKNKIFVEDFETEENFNNGKLKGNGRITTDEVFAKNNSKPDRAENVLRDYSGSVYELSSRENLALTVTVNETSCISFNYKSDIIYSNGLSVSVDDKLVGKFGGNGEPWKKVTIQLLPGTHTVKWEVPFLFSIAPGLENTVYIDNITVVKDKPAFVEIYPKGLQQTYINGEPLLFKAKAFRGDKSEIKDAEITLSVTGCGSINNKGLFIPESEGRCSVVAECNGIKGENNNIVVHNKDYLSEPVTIGKNTFQGYRGSAGYNRTQNIIFDPPTPDFTTTVSTDGFFVIKGRTNTPFLINVVKEGTGTKESKPLETTFFVRKPGEFYKRIWLRFGSGVYNILISEITELKTSQPADNRYDGDIKSYGYYGGGELTIRFNAVNTNSSLSEEEATYIMPSEVVQSDSFLVSNVSNAVQAELYNFTQGDILRALHDWELYNFYYDMVSVNNNGIQRKRQDAEHVIKYGTGVCEGYANLYAALVRNAGIKAKVICNKEMLHAWNHIYYDKNWYLTDVTWDDPVPQNADDSYNDRSPGREIYTYFMTAKTDNKHTTEGEADTGRSIIKEGTAPAMTGMPDGWY